jgi:hypothetical protein
LYWLYSINHHISVKLTIVCYVLIQLQLNDVVVKETTKSLTARPTGEDHAIIVEDLFKPLDLHRVTLLFHGRKATILEYDNGKMIELTSPFPNQEPLDEIIAEEEHCKTTMKKPLQVISWQYMMRRIFARDLYEAHCVSGVSSDHPRYHQQSVQLGLTNCRLEQTTWALTRWAINYHTNATRGQA